MVHFRTLLFLLCLAWPTWGQAALPEPLRTQMDRLGIDGSAVGLWVQNLAHVSPELAHQPDTAFNPASVMKLVTTLAALDTLGPAHVWKTRVWIRGPLEDGVLHGDLILQGGGDPSLTQERFWALLREVYARGVREIRGDVVIDNGFYGIEPEDPGAFDQAPLKPYNAAPTALLVNYNVLTLRLYPQDGQAMARLDPPGLPVVTGLSLDARSPCNHWRNRLDIRREGDRLEVFGSYPLACGEQRVWLNLMCPPATAATLFRALWGELGGTHTGQIRLGEMPGDARLWLEHDSEPLSLIARDVNKFSNNVMAKMLLLNLGAHRHGGPATWEKGQATLHAWLAEKGINAPELVVENGAGLSRLERASPRTMARLLHWAAQQPLFYEFAASLPALGLEGTQRNRLRDSPNAGRAWLKTGSLNGVRNLAGYFMDTAGRRKSLVLFIQQQDPARAAKLQEAVLNWVLDMDH